MRTFTFFGEVVGDRAMAEKKPLQQRECPWWFDAAAGTRLLSGKVINAHLISRSASVLTKYPPIDDDLFDDVPTSPIPLPLDPRMITSPAYAIHRYHAAQMYTAIEAANRAPSEDEIKRDYLRLRPAPTRVPGPGVTMKDRHALPPTDQINCRCIPSPYTVTDRVVAMSLLMWFAIVLTCMIVGGALAFLVSKL